MQVKSLTPETVKKNKLDIVQFYFNNAITCSCSTNFTIEEAEAKIDEFIAYLEKDECIGYGLFHENRVCGYIWAYPHQFREERRMYISEIHIEENYRNRGYGKMLLEAVEAKAKEKGLGALYLHAEADNKSAIRLYESCGYIEERIQLRKEIK